MENKPDTQAEIESLRADLAVALHLISDIMTFAQHDEDCHINNLEDKYHIPECTCGYTEKSMDCLKLLERLTNNVAR